MNEKNFNDYYNELNKCLMHYENIDKTKLISNKCLEIQFLIDCISYYTQACLTYKRCKSIFQDDITSIIGKINFTDKEKVLERFHCKRSYPVISKELNKCIELCHDIAQKEATEVYVIQQFKEMLN